MLHPPQGRSNLPPRARASSRPGSSGAALPAAKDFTQSLAHGLIPQSALDTAKQLSTDLAYGFRGAKNDIAEAFRGVRDKIASKFSGISDTVGASSPPSRTRSAALTSVLGESAKNAVDKFAAKARPVWPGREGEGPSARSDRQPAGSPRRGRGDQRARAAATGLLGLRPYGRRRRGRPQEDGGRFCFQHAADHRQPAGPGGSGRSDPPTLVSQVVDNLPAFLSAIQQAFSPGRRSLPTIMPALIDGVVQLVTALATMLDTMAPQLLDAGLQLFIALVEAFAEMVPQLTLLPDLVSKNWRESWSKRTGPAQSRVHLVQGSGLGFSADGAAADLVFAPADQPGALHRGSWMPSLGSAASQLFGMIVQAVPGIAGSAARRAPVASRPAPGAVASVRRQPGLGRLQHAHGPHCPASRARAAVWERHRQRLQQRAPARSRTSSGSTRPSRVLAAVGRYRQGPGRHRCPDTADGRCRP